ncbi:MAG: hypothetical protein ACRDHX_13320 [Chloroflexota bacterium]
MAIAKHLVELDVARSQDAVVEQAIRELDRAVESAREADLWKQAANDKAFQVEATELDRLFARDDAAAWRD